MDNAQLVKIKIRFTLSNCASVLQADPKSALSAQGRVQGDDGRTEGPGPSPHSRYALIWLRGEVVIGRQYLPH